MKGAIRVSVDYDRDNAYLHVKDTGVGIPESGMWHAVPSRLLLNGPMADIDKVFDRFHRVDVSFSLGLRVSPYL